MRGLRELGSKLLFVSDMDGTLLGADSRVSEMSREYLKQLNDRGVMISVATARTPATADGLLEGCGMRLPYVVMTGAALWHPVDKRYINPKYIPVEHSRGIREICTRHGLYPIDYRLYDDGILHAYFNGVMNNRCRKFIDERRALRLKRMHVDEPDGLRLSESTLLYFAVSNYEDISACAAELKESLPCSVSAYRDIFNKEVGLMEVFAEGVSKASAIEELVKMCGADATVVFGDNLNDLDMMKIAGRSVAVANAFDEVKLQADEIIGPNTADSVVAYIREATGV